MRTRAILVVVLVFAGCLERRPDEKTSRPSECTACHGSQSREGTETVRAAPPTDLAGNSAVTAPGVGAHQLHLTESATHAAVACDECHVVPATVTAPGHIDKPAPARIVFGPVARANGHDGGAYDPVTRTCTNDYCHRDAKPVWTSPRTSEKACGTCHTLPPPPPHPVVDKCSVCHGSVVGPDNLTIIAPALHANGQVEVAVPQTCNGCHGSPESWAPPPALNGFYDTTYVGVGAHQKHLTGVTITRLLECSDCHVVPVKVLEPGHIDTPRPAEVTFSGRALLTNAGTPPYPAMWDDAGSNTCRVYCHDPGMGRWEGQNVRPIWTESGQTYCGSCHGQPPPPPHPPRPDAGLSVCADCHKNITVNGEFIDLNQHINGVINL
jgi:predicted CxxxxCH...CXXCH cytochrome family protein